MAVQARQHHRNFHSILRADGQAGAAYAAIRLARGEAAE
jgi:hypothetical protein